MCNLQGKGAGLEQLGLNMALVCRHWGYWVPWGKSYLGDMGQRPQALVGCGPGRWRRRGCRRAAAVCLALGCSPGKALVRASLRLGRGTKLLSGSSLGKARRRRLSEGKGIS